MIIINMAFVGGGVCSVIGLGEYSLLEEKGIDNVTFSFSGASIGAVIAICLAAGKSPKGIRNFLADNVEAFCVPILGNKRIERKVNEYLGYMLYRDLPRECIVSVTPILRKDVPCIITRENSERLTVGEVAAFSAALPGLFLPRLTKLDGKHAFIVDGAILYNPPLDYTANANLIFSYRKNYEAPKFSWNKRRAEQERRGDMLLNPLTKCGTRGKRNDVFEAYEEGRKYAYARGFDDIFEKLSIENELGC